MNVTSKLKQPHVVTLYSLTLPQHGAVYGKCSVQLAPFVMWKSFKTVMESLKGVALLSTTTPLVLLGQSVSLVYISLGITALGRPQ